MDRTFKKMNQKGFEQVSSIYQKGVPKQQYAEHPTQGFNTNFPKPGKRENTLNKEIIALERK